MSGFNAEDFLYTETEQELDTKFIPVPQGDYDAQCAKVEVLSGDSEKTESGKYAMLKLSWEITDPSVKDVTQRDVNRVTQTVFLDLTSDAKLDFGPQKNIGLGRLYSAVGLPTKGSSPKQVEGQFAKVRVKHTPIKDTDPIEYRAEVSSVMSV